MSWLRARIQKPKTNQDDEDQPSCYSICNSLLGGRQANRHPEESASQVPQLLDDPRIGSQWLVIYIKSRITGRRKVFSGIHTTLKKWHFE
ncbi:hypothetical protein ACFX13_022568 [Malus domestica]